MTSKLKPYVSSKTIVLAIILLLTGYALGHLGETPDVDHTHTEAVEKNDSSVYTCSMHPQIEMDQPGQCPICFMDLIPRESASTQLGDYQIALDDSEAADPLRKNAFALTGWLQKTIELRVSGEQVLDFRLQLEVGAACCSQKLGPFVRSDLECTTEEPFDAPISFRIHPLSFSSAL